MTKKTHMCANPCAKGKAGGCVGACAIDFLGFETGARTVRAKVGKSLAPDFGQAGGKDEEPLG